MLDEAAASNPGRLLLALDELLDHAVSLVLYGRASVWLGFDHPPLEVGATRDVDAIIRMSQLDEIVNDSQFWDARDEVNRRFDSEGLYITHLFQEDQVFRRPGWLEHIVPITKLTTRRLELFRPATLDLILTKMMRGDDEWDMQDIDFMIRHDRLSVASLEEAMGLAIIPDLQDYRDAFDKARTQVLKLAREACAG